MRNVKIKTHRPLRNGDAFGTTLRCTAEETGIEFLVELTVTGDGNVRVELGPYNGRKETTYLGDLEEVSKRLDMNYLGD